MPELPDPTEDLHWDEFAAPIHDVFAKNADSFPDRVCVIETAKGNHFTYRHIHYASNILAHHLVASGIQREEVVMIYSSRGVDLVVAIMGILKAGATFSVIDPTYPNERQIDYLDIARPRALVVLAEAARKKGGLAPEARDWVTQNLDLRTSIPGLELLPDGSLLGGELASGADTLYESQARASQSTGIVVGPDSCPTLSFTSGSEGKPKGVRGRHFSLVHYYPWMKERFNLSENSRFTMLSGIAHDPIQRDVYTPLWLGAQLLVPSEEDIQGGRLAKWCEDYSPTVTHLTPAMGQILTTSADGLIPSLEHAFLVGDVLIKRDVKRLQHIAPNCTVVNMFGSTETQRAVSYFAVPDRNTEPKFLNDVSGELIPAGQGMKGVQLLVVDRENSQRICDINQEGEVYVRAAGLGEGYLNLPDTTAAKFLQSWFVDPQKWLIEEQARLKSRGTIPEPWRRAPIWKGPRDRLYRTGDKGWYDSNGNVHVKGRIDDQVKLEGGYRFELGEINKHLGDVPGVRLRYTMLDEDSRGRRFLVSYIVPEVIHPDISDPNKADMITMLKSYSKLCDDARSRLKAKVPPYAVPRNIIPLRKFPLNPNGKVDKKQLPRPTAADFAIAVDGSMSNRTSQRSETENAIAEIWSSFLEGIDAQAIGSNQSFVSLGGTSVEYPSVNGEMKRHWKSQAGSLPSQTEYAEASLREFASAIDRTLSGMNGHLIGDVHPEHIDDCLRLLQESPANYPAKKASSKPLTVLLTGATGFVGSFILKDLLSRPDVEVVAHVRTQQHASPLQRVRDTCIAYGLWSDSWASRLTCISGNLSEQRLGVSMSDWSHLAETVDIVIHNGAEVNWAKPYNRLRESNVLSTLELLRFASKGKAKQVALVSSTAVLESDWLARLSQELIKQGKNGIPENIELDGRGLDSGYASGKWTSEKLVQEARKRGLSASVVRLGYVLGDSATGVCITDDFLVRMLKQCIKLQSRPRIDNSINMVPVDHAARVIVASALYPPVDDLGVVHVTPHPRMTWTRYLEALEKYGYVVSQCDYESWKRPLEERPRQGVVNVEEFPV